MTELILNQEIYDTILDSLDSEHKTLVHNIFIKYNLTYNSKLFDAPRHCFNDTLLETYLDYVLAFNLSNILDFLIDDMHLAIDDTIFIRCLELENFESYKYIISLGYTPQINTFKHAVHNCYSLVVENILVSDIEFINELNEHDVENIFNYNIDSDTVEMLYMLFNYGVNPDIFNRYLIALKDPTGTQIMINDTEREFAHEIIEILECNCKT